jgi:MinD-like ATPase involved in chromosome partitioning or flagellar assembly
MHVVALVTQKGGSGKSTLAVGLAVAAMRDGGRVALIEADAQGTISKWQERRESVYPRVERVTAPDDIDAAVARLTAEGAWLAIIDTAATNNALAMRAITMADLCLIPARPSPADIEAAIPTKTPLRFRAQPDAVAGCPPERGRDIAQRARRAGASLHRAAQRSPGRARHGAWRHRIGARRKSRRRDSRFVVVDHIETCGGGARPWASRDQESQLKRFRAKWELLHVKKTRRTESRRARCAVRSSTSPRPRAVPPRTAYRHCRLLRRATIHRVVHMRLHHLLKGGGDRTEHG